MHYCQRIQGRGPAIWEVSTLDRDRVPYAQDYFLEPDLWGSSGCFDKKIKCLRGAREQISIFVP
jgi:hypothetical protein